MEEVRERSTKKTRFALLQNQRFARIQDRDPMEQVRRSNARVVRADELRVAFEHLRKQRDARPTLDFASRWTKGALLSRIEPLRRFARRVRQHPDGVLGFSRHCGRTSRIMDDTDNKIKLLIHRAFGLHKVAALVAMIRLCCSGSRLT